MTEGTKMITQLFKDYCMKQPQEQTDRQTPNNKKIIAPENTLEAYSQENLLLANYKREKLKREQEDLFLFAHLVQDWNKKKREGQENANN